MRLKCGLLFGVSAWAAGAQCQTSPSTDAPPETYIARISPDRDEVFLDRYQLVGEDRINIGTLRIDRARARELNLPWFYLSRSDPREELARRGVLFDPATGPMPKADDIASNTSATSNIVEVSSNASATSGGNGVGLWQWIKDNLAIILAFASVPLWGWLATIALRRFNAVRTRKLVDILYAGLPATGKTALIARLRQPNLSPEHFDSDETTRMVEKKKYEPIVKSGLTFHLTAYDIPGGKPGSFIDRIRERRPFLGRRVLLVVLAPFGINPGSPGVPDADFMNKQEGYVFGLIEGVLTAQNLPKPDLVVVFLNKSDMFAGTAEQFRAAFKETTDRIALVCKDRRIKCIRVGGSARNGDGTQGLLGSIIEGIGG